MENENKSGKWWGIDEVYHDKVFDELTDEINKRADIIDEAEVYCRKWGSCHQHTDFIELKSLIFTEKIIKELKEKFKGDAGFLCSVKAGDFVSYITINATNPCGDTDYYNVYSSEDITDVLDEDLVEIEEGVYEYRD